jgi:hypothetical protein
LQCTTVISGDPKIEDLIYHLDTGVFEYEGEPDLSVVHVRCQVPTSKASAYDQQSNTQYDSNYAPIEPPTLTLNETDFEQPVTIIFQISEWPGKGDGELTEQIVKDKLNQDFLWTNLTDKSLSEEERNYEDYYSVYEKAKYNELRGIASGTKPWPSYGALLWYGEVGRMVFARSRAAPRDFMWTLHNDKDIARKVSQMNLCW